MKKLLIIAFVFSLLGNVFAQPYTEQMQILEKLKEQENRKNNKIKKIKEKYFESTIDRPIKFMEQINSINSIDSIDSILDALNLKNKAHIKQKISIYDKNGCFIESKVLYNKNETKSSNATYIYDNDGHLLETNTSFQKITYIYTNGNLNKREYYNKYDSTNYCNYFIYDSIGRVKTEIRSDTIDYYYDSKGKIIKAIRKDIYNSIRTYEYVYDKDKITEENIFSNGKPYINKQFKYDKNNNLISIIEFHPSKHQPDDYFIIKNYIYDESEKIIIKNISQGKTENNCKLTYKEFIKYNNEDNEILNISIRWGFEDMEAPLLYVRKIVKSYEYYMY